MLRYEIGKRIEKATMWFVWKLPRTVIYWAVIRVWAHGTTGDYGNTIPDELTWGEALKRWKAPNA